MNKNKHGVGNDNSLQYSYIWKISWTEELGSNQEVAELDTTEHTHMNKNNIKMS